MQSMPCKKKSNTVVTAPTGMEWDNINYSCAYDALFTPMYAIWDEHGPKWTELFKDVGIHLYTLARGFQRFRSGTGKLESARDSVRTILTESQPLLFPVGQSFTGINDLANSMFGGVEWGTKTLKCMKCG
jgi:hypothetical protein